MGGVYFQCLVRLSLFTTPNFDELGTFGDDYLVLNCVGTSLENDNYVCVAKMVKIVIIVVIVS